MTIEDGSLGNRPRARRPPKCVVWDLDNTLWSGILLEGDDVRLRPGIRDVIEALDARGILNSIASHNEPGPALARLRELGIEDYFLCPQLGWGAKSRSVRVIADALGIGLDAIAFVDDQAFERDEVQTATQVACFNAAEPALLLDALDAREMTISEESKSRRAMYRADALRRLAEASFDGPAESFLATLEMVVTIAPAHDTDLERAEELTVRTNQLNSTGWTYSLEELAVFCRSSDHELLVVSLDDRYGSYGRIGLALIEHTAGLRILKLLLMSCRVMSRGIGTVVLHQIMREARAAGVRLQAHFVRTGRNRQMFITYRLSGYRETSSHGDLLLLEHDLELIPSPPSYVRLIRREAHRTCQALSPTAHSMGSRAMTQNTEPTKD